MRFKPFALAGSIGYTPDELPPRKTRLPEGQALESLESVEDRIAGVEEELCIQSIEPLSRVAASPPPPCNPPVTDPTPSESCGLPVAGVRYLRVPATPSSPFLAYSQIQ
jgi:hypothetical protein